LSAIKEIHWQDPDKFLVGFILFNILLGAFIVSAYGEGWDNILMHDYGMQTVEIYRNPTASYTEKDFGPVDSMFFGPFVVTIAGFAVEFLHFLGAASEPLVVFRYIYFLTHLVGVACFYFLCKRFMRDWFALVATLLYASQPLFFGLALINPKDTPFNALFIAAIFTGMLMVDELSEPPASEKSIKIWGTFSRKRWLLMLFWVVLFITYWIARARIQQMVGLWVFDIYHADPSTFLGSIFDLVASNARVSPVEIYQVKGISLFHVFVLISFAVSLIVLVFPRLPGEIFASLKNKKLVIAGIVLGLCVSVRMLALFAGALIVFMCFSDRTWRKFILPLIAYGLTVVFTVYLTWPFLWDAPVSRFIQIFKFSFGHVHHVPVLFNGQTYPADALPKIYLPALFAIQFTEPAVLFAVAGIVLVFVAWLFSLRLGIFGRIKSPDWLLSTRIRTQIENRSILLPFLWFGLPVFASLILNLSFHDNFRHFLFITPPLFIFAGIGIEVLMQYIKPNWARWGIVLLILLPGVINILRSQPYEYIYFNRFIGGIKGAAHRFSLDYMGASLKESFDYINEIAEPDATVLVLGSIEVAKAYAREDLRVIDRFDHPDWEITNEKTYLVAKARLSSTPERILLFQVTSGGVVIGSVHKYILE